MDDDAYRNLQAYLMLHPEAGDVVPETGGCRKIRWAIKGRGKRGGIRLVYYYRQAKGQIWMLTIYAKNEIENIPSYVLRSLKEEIDRG